MKSRLIKKNRTFASLKSKIRCKKYCIMLWHGSQRFDSNQKCIDSQIRVTVKYFENLINFHTTSLLISILINNWNDFLISSGFFDRMWFPRVLSTGNYWKIPMRARNHSKQNDNWYQWWSDIFLILKIKCIMEKKCIKKM